MVVMPFDPNIIWVGTENGLLESTDRGESWNLVNSSLPNVMINDFEIGDFIEAFSIEEIAQSL